ncbi:MAG: VOC family protein [Alphaproteobacteria bacterium]
MIDHFSIGVNDMKKSRVFYDRVLEPLGYSRLIDDGERASGYGTEVPRFWIDIPLNEKPASTGNGMHIAFTAPTRWAVDAFHEQALLMGGQDQGAPGLRPEYGEHYYAAFVLDLDGHKIEAVIHLPETH